MKKNKKTLLWLPENISWSLRRLCCPVPNHALVLEVGSGGNPYPRSNILLDSQEESIERIEKDLRRDRPLVIGIGENLPFKTKCFDFSIASHVLEHSKDPETFLRELMRVSKAGYIETPDGFFERINPYTYHRSEVRNIDNKLIITKKSSWKRDDTLVTDYERQMKNNQFIKFISRHPVAFYMQYRWQNTICFEVTNPEVDASWEIPTPTKKRQILPLAAKIKRMVCDYLFGQKTRNKQIHVCDYLRCPRCFYEQGLYESNRTITCPQCHHVYEKKNGLPIMMQPPHTLHTL
jgi:SAM-dependent methyltransferase